MRWENRNFDDMGTLTCGQRQLVSTHDSEQFESLCATWVPVQN